MYKRLAYEQIVHRLKLPISVKAIYAYLKRHKSRCQAEIACLRRKGKKPRKRWVKDTRGKNRLPHRVSIHQRPAIVECKGRLGDWEGDTLVGKGHHTAIVSLVERKSAFTKLIKVEGKDANALAARVVRK